jgi:hypothetical protein
MPNVRESIAGPHENPNVLAMWDKFFAICDYASMLQSGAKMIIP